MEKKISGSRFLIEYALIAFGVYLLISFIVALIGNYGYREILCSAGQIPATIFCYGWVPIPRMVDLEQRNQRIEEQERKARY